MTPDAAEKAHTAAWDQIHAGSDPGQARVEAKKAAREEKRVSNRWATSLNWRSVTSQGA